MRMLTKENMLFGAAGFAVFALNSIFLTFSVLFFNEAGYSESQIGFMLSATVLLSMVSQVLTGYLCDNVITIKKIVFLDIIVSVAAVLLMIPAKNSYLALFALYGAYSLTGRMASNLIDSYITRVAQRRSALDFGFTRGISSIGWGFASLFGGWLIRGLGIHMMFVLHTIFGVLAAVIVLLLEDVPLAKKQAPGGKESEGLLASASAVFRLPGFMLTTFACLLIFLGVNTPHPYFSLIVVAVGGDSSDVGLGIFLLAVSEVPLLWNFYRLAGRVKDSHMILCSIAMYVVKAILLLSFQTVEGVVWIQAMQGVTYALFLPSILRFMQTLLPERYMTTGIMLWVAIYNSGSQILGSLLGGFLLEHYGFVPLYYILGSLAIVGGCMMAYVMKRYGGESKNNKAVEA